MALVNGGREVAPRSEFRLFHNHAMLEPLLEVFDYGTAPFMRVLGECRRRVIEEAASSDTDLVLTYVWGLEHEDDVREDGVYLRPYVERGAAVSFVQLYSNLDTRLERGRTEHRLAEKRSIPDVIWSNDDVRQLEQHVTNTGGDAAPGGERLLAGHRHLRIDKTDLSADETAEEVQTWLGRL